MGKGLKALKELKERYGKNFSIQDDKRTHVIERELKALEIIKNNFTFRFEKIDNKMIKAFFLYVNGVLVLEIKTEEEFDLLKEVLL